MVDVHRGDGGRVGIRGDARLALRTRLAGALDAAALEAFVNAEDNVVGDECLEIRDLLHAETAESGTDDVRGKTEEALSDLRDTGVLAVEA